MLAPAEDIIEWTASTPHLAELNNGFAEARITMIRCLFREPTFPVICHAGLLIAATSLRDFDAQVETLDLPPDGNFPIVDASAEGWVFNTQHAVLSPLTPKNHWTKKEVIAMFNGSDVARKLGMLYSERSLSAKRFDRIVREIATLIRSANKASNPRR
jgi:hypothetical protein